MRDKSSVAIIDVGSSTLVTLIGERGVNNSFKISGRGDIYYAGFHSAEFLEPENLKFAVANSLSNAEMLSDKKIYEIYVGVPGEFCSCVTKSINLTFPKTKKITQADVQSIFDSGNDFHDDPMYKVINKSVIYYEIDGVKRVIDPIGLKAKSITGHISFILARKSFVTMFQTIFAELKVMVRGFISANLAESLYLFDHRTRDKYALLVDVGYITTNVSLARGNGLLFLNSFSLGGGYITSDLAECLKTSFSEAERLKHKLVLGWNASPTDYYEIDGADGHKKTYSAKAANEISIERIKMICEYIQKCLDNCIYDLPEFLPINVTGGGFNFIKGIKTLLSTQLKRKVNMLSPTLPSVQGPDYSSEIGLLDLTLNYDDSLDTLLEK